MKRLVIVPLREGVLGTAFYVSERALGLSEFSITKFIPDTSEKNIEVLIRLIGVISDLENESTSMFVFIWGGDDEAEELCGLLDPHAIGNRLVLEIDCPFNGEDTCCFNPHDVISGDLLAQAVDSVHDN